jgi:hypothetical protein
MWTIKGLVSLILQGRGHCAAAGAAVNVAASFNAASTAVAFLLMPPGWLVSALCAAGTLTAELAACARRHLLQARLHTC